jgi:oxaloacetate decarboxylase alpha subunit
MPSNPIGITDTTLRDAHQSLWATRMRIEDMRPVLAHIDRVGYHSLEVWGGATFDVCLRYLNEDPWLRLSEIRESVKNTKLQMLLRGQNIVGYRNYPDDVLEEFVRHGADRGLDIFRIFDALNDARNLEKAIEFVKKADKHAQGTLCYAISPVHTLEYYVDRAREQKDMGIDSICIKDMAGILAPQPAYELVSALKSELGLMVQLHCHASSGMAVATYLKAAEAGVDVIDTASAPLSFSTSQPAGETLAASFRGTERDPELNLEEMEFVQKHFEKAESGRCIQGTKVVDAMVITHQIPGGMASNLLNQLTEQKAGDRLAEVLDEVPRVREDLGYPPLVTPTSQIVGVQAVMNVLSGERYKLIPNEVRDYVKGLYGRSPAPVRESVMTKILGKDKPIKTRPADRLEPLMPKVRKELSKDLVEKEEDYISYALFPEVSLKFFQWRKNPTKPEPDKPKDKGGPDKPATAQEAFQVPAGVKPDEVGVWTVRELIELTAAHGVSELEWEHKKDKIRIRRGGELQAAASAASAPVPVRTPPVVQKTVAEPEARVAEEEPEEEPASFATEPAPQPVTPAGANVEEVTSPMVGTFYLRPRPDAPAFIEPGDVIEVGQTLCIVEAMKLMNEIQAEKTCRIVEVLIQDGESVEYGQPLILVEPQ